jgi:hypothetical protein
MRAQLHQVIRSFVGSCILLAQLLPDGDTEFVDLGQMPEQSSMIFFCPGLTDARCGVVDKRTSGFGGGITTYTSPAVHQCGGFKVPPYSYEHPLVPPQLSHL